MATLVQFLVSGVRGAESGTATFLLRGTASSAASVLYNDFEATAQPGTNVITLDSNGAAEVYTEAYVDVVIRSSAGDILRTVTVGNSAPVVEVQSTSFTGTDYDGNPANTVGEPITLKALLDKWILSAGAPDWQVLVDGVATDLDAAVAGFTGMFINVKSSEYGALGDGVTDDTTAITAAIADADGGIVFFPPGTYKVTALSINDGNVNFLGSGAGISIISGSTSVNLISLNDNTNTTWKNFTGLSFTSSGSYTRLFSLEHNQNVTFRNCTFDASNCSDEAVAVASTAGLSKLYFTDCDFLLGASTDTGILNSQATSGRNISLTGCTFKVPSGFTGFILAGADFNVTGCRFDASAVTSGVYYAIDASDQSSAGKYVGSFVGNHFIDGGSTGFAFDLRAVTALSNFTESGNTFTGFTAPADATEQGHIYDLSSAGTYTSTTVVNLGSRKGRSLAFAVSASPLLDIRAQAIAETIVITSTAASTFNTRADEDYIPPGHSYSFIVLQSDASAQDIGFGDGVDTVTESAVGTGGRAFFEAKTYVGEGSAVEISVFAHGKASN